MPARVEQGDSDARTRQLCCACAAGSASANYRHGEFLRWREGSRELHSLRGRPARAPMATAAPAAASPAASPAASAAAAPARRPPSRAVPRLPPPAAARASAMAPCPHPRAAALWLSFWRAPAAPSRCSARGVRRGVRADTASRPAFILFGSGAPAVHRCHTRTTPAHARAGAQDAPRGRSHARAPPAPRAARGSVPPGE